MMQLSFRSGLMPMVVGVLAALFFFLLAPQNTFAAVRTATNATSTSNNASTTLAKTGDIISFQLNLDGGVSATNTPMISIKNMGTTTMTGAAGAALWTYSTTTTSGWTEGNVTFNMVWMGSVGEATSTLVSTASTTIRYVVFDKTAPSAPTQLYFRSSNASTTLAKAGDIITLYASTTENIETPTITIAGSAATVTLLTASTSWKATYTVVSGDTNQNAALTFDFTDAAGNSGTQVTTSTSTIVYIDTAAPSISVSGSNPDSVMCCSSSAYSDAGASATDVHDGSISVSTSGTVNRALGGTYTLTYTATDTAGNSSTATRTVNITASDSGGIFVGNVTAPKMPLPGALSEPLPVTPSTASSEASLIATLRAQVQALLAQLAALSGSPASAVPTFARDLQRGATGDDVKALQVYLNTHGYAVASSGPGSRGNETTTFGNATKAALAKFQKAVGITPSSGYLGPKTRAYIAANQ